MHVQQNLKLYFVSISYISHLQKLSRTFPFTQLVTAIKKLTLQVTAVNVCNRSFNVPNLCTLPTHLTYVSCDQYRKESLLLL